MHHRTCAMLTSLAVIMATTFVITARADEVTDWNQYMLQAALVAKTTPIPMTRNAAIVQAAVFDAVNGINPRYTPIHVKSAAPGGASRRAAAVLRNRFRDPSTASVPPRLTGREPVLSWAISSIGVACWKYDWKPGSS